MLTSAKWRGHHAPVSCLDIQEDLLLSGSEDKTARLWDIKENSRRRASLCISTPGEIFSVKFAPRHPDSMPNADLSNSFAKDHTIYVSMGHVVLEYDLRKASSPILSMPSNDISDVLQHQDEVNQIAAMYYTKPRKKGKGKGKPATSSSEPQLYLATADDAGTIRFMQSNSGQSHILHHDPNGVAVVPSCAFRPGCIHSLDLVSGGTDCKIHLWDALKPKRPVASYTIKQPDNGDANKPQVCNPPMVHSLAWSPSGKLLVAGLGDGNIPIFSIENRNLVQTGYLPDGYDSSVACVTFPRFAIENERMVVSAGSDGSILVWDVGTNVMELADVADPKELFSSDFIDATNDKTEESDLAQRVEEFSLGKAKILFGIPHDNKVNWITTSQQSIFVADTSHDITEYTLPLR